MAAIQTASVRLSTPGGFAWLARQEAHAAARRTWVVLLLGLVNLLAGLVFQANDWLPTFAVLDVIYANFACALWVAVVYAGAQRPLDTCAMGIAAKTAALAVVVSTTLTLAGLVAVAGQLWHGDAPLEWPLFAAGLYANVGWSALHLAMLAVAVRATIRRAWLSVAATGLLWTATNVVFEHPVLRFGVPISPASGMNGFGPFLAPQVALGIHWTGFCIVLLTFSHLAAGRRWDGAAARNAFAFVWTAAIAWVVSGGWIVYQLAIEKDTTAETRTAAPEHPQPVYSRLALDIVISPLERLLVSRGTAIAVNRLDVAIPELHFGIPRSLEVVALTMTGEFVGKNENTRCHHYRLNRPLEPKETIKIEFEAKWVAQNFAHDPTSLRLLQNGTFVSTTHVVPALGCSTTPHPFRSAPPVAFRARIGTSLDQIAVTAGVLIRAWKENGWSYYEYESQAPMSPFTTVHSGHYAIRRIAAQEGSIEVYYHPPHKGRVGHMIEAGRAALARQSTLSPGAQPVIRVVEVPDYRPFRQLGFLGIYAAETRRGRACPVPVDLRGKYRHGAGAHLSGAIAPPPRAYTTERAVYETSGMVLPYSERGYPLSTPPPSESTPPRA